MLTAIGSSLRYDNQFSVEQLPPYGDDTSKFFMVEEWTASAADTTAQENLITSGAQTLNDRAMSWVSFLS